MTRLGTLWDELSLSAIARRPASSRRRRPTFPPPQLATWAPSPDVDAIDATELSISSTAAGLCRRSGVGGAHPNSSTSPRPRPSCFHGGNETSAVKIYHLFHRHPFFSARFS